MTEEHEDDENVYDEESRETLVDNDEISPEEEGFMFGYDEEEKKKDGDKDADEEEDKNEEE